MEMQLESYEPQRAQGLNHKDTRDTKMHEVI
jgi:hypothetical protein